MLVVDLRNTRINVYNYSVVGNKNSDTIYFYYPKKYQDYDVYIKVLGENIADKFRIYSPNIEVKNDCIRAKWIMPQSVTVNKEIQVQLEYDITLLGGGEIAQSKIVTLKLQNTLDIEGSVEPIYPSILQELREDLEAEILHREQGDSALHQEIVDEETRAKGVETDLQNAIDNKVDKVEGKGLSTNDYTDADKNKLAGVEAGAQANVLEGVKINNQPLTPTNKVVNIDLTPYALITDMQTYGKSLAVSIDPQTYVLTMSLKDANGDTLNTQTVDLPLETMVVSGSYDDTTKSLILVLKNGQTIIIPVADLVAGLVSETQLAQTLLSYYTKTETDNLLNAKADKTQTEADKLKALYHLGAFDTVDTSNADYDLITRQTGYLKLWEQEWSYNPTYYSFFCFSYKPLAYPTGDNGVAIAMKCTAYKTLSWVEVGTITGIAISGDAEWIRINDSSLNGDVNSLLAKLNGVILQYKTATSYTEKVIKNQPLNTLDQQGSEFVRKEWEKTQNLWSLAQVTFGNEIEMASFLTGLGVGTYSFKITSSRQTSYSEFHWYLRDLTTATTLLDGILPNTEYSFTFDSSLQGHDIRLYSWGTTSSDACYMMFNRGDHAYPYQPYNGAIVHEKDIENVAKTNVNNFFTAHQTFTGNDDTAFSVKVPSTAYTRTNILFANAQGDQLGNIGFNSDYKPEIYSMLDRTWHDIVIDSDLDPINDLLAELKTIVYDNQYPAVAEIDLHYATYYALPSQISGDKIIMSAGMDMTKVKGRSYVYNQWASNNDFSGELGSGSLVCSNSVWTGSIPSYQGESSSAYSFIPITQKTAGHKYLVLLKDFKQTNGGFSIRFGNEFGFELIWDYTNPSNYPCMIVTAEESSGTLSIGFDARYSANDGLFPKTVSFTMVVSDLTQWFGSNDNIPADLLADPSLFTKKYWKKPLPFDTGHIEDSKPVKVVSIGVNKLNINDAVVISNITKTTTGFEFTNGNASGSPTYLAVKVSDFFPNIKVGETYTFTCEATNQMFNEFYLNGSLTDWLWGTPHTFTQDELDGLLLVYGKQNLLCKLEKCMLVNSSTAMPFQPFSRKEYPIIPIDMGTYTFTGNETLTVLSADRFTFDGLASSIKIPSSNSEVANATMEGFTIDTKAHVESKPYQFAVGTDGSVYFHLENGTTQAEALEFLAGRTLTYELATQSHNPLRSAGSVQDDNEKVRVGSYVVDINEGTWDYGGWREDTITLRVGIQDHSPQIHSVNVICDKYANMDTYWDTNYEYFYFLNATNMFGDLETFKTFINGAKILYELATPTDQSPAITLPENIEIQKGGTIEIEYDDGYSTPCDINFEVAVSKVLEE